MTVLGAIAAVPLEKKQKLLIGCSRGLQLSYDTPKCLQGLAVSLSVCARGDENPLCLKYNPSQEEISMKRIIKSPLIYAVNWCCQSMSPRQCT